MPTVTVSTVTTLDELYADGTVVPSETLDTPIVIESDPTARAERKCELCDKQFMYDPDNARHLRGQMFSFWNEKRTWNYVCDECTDVCSDCGSEPAPIIGSSRIVVGEWYHPNLCNGCSENYSTCGRCDDVIHNSDVEYVYSDNTYCSDCRERVASWCNQCDQYEYNDDMCDVSNGNIHNYSYKPDPMFHGASDTHMYFGIELEVEAKNADLNDGADLMVNEWEDFAYLKEDGSLNFGFEIVTHPATLDYYQKQVKWSAIDQLREMGFRSWNSSTCGLHVHVDRRAFKDRTHLMAFTYLLNNNKNLSVHVAGRNSSYGTIGNNSKVDNVYTIKGYTRGRGGDRYNAINLQNTNTVEIRIFKGSLKIERILSGIEFTHALVTYSRDIRSGMQAMNMLRPEEFMSWIRKQGTYPNLVQFLPELAVIVSTDDNEMEE